VVLFCRLLQEQQDRVLGVQEKSNFRLYEDTSVYSGREGSDIQDKEVPTSVEQGDKRVCAWELKGELLSNT
jgi:hypothetical protein